MDQFFVVYTVGLDCVILAAIIYVVDFLGRTKWTKFFTVFGKNPLFIYLVSEVGVTILDMIHLGARRKPVFLALSTYLSDMQVFISAPSYLPFPGCYSAGSSDFIWIRRRFMSGFE